MTEIVMLEGPDTLAAELETFKTEFLRWAAQPDLSQPCPVGRLVRAESNDMYRRQMIWETVAEAMAEKNDFTRRAVELLCSSAQGFYRTEGIRELLSDMAEHWAELRCDL